MKRFSLAMAAAALLLAGCAGSRPAEPAAHPGFDTWQYPGDAAMETWREASPYRWVGYYLPAPCHRDSSWAGRRAALEAMGWGLAVLYVGQQVFEGQPPPEVGGPDGVGAGAPDVVCSRTLLTEDQGRRDAADAAARAAAEGFPPGTTVFLDVERTTTIPPELTVYVRTWMDAVLADGRYRPGLYAHRINADALFAQAMAAYHTAGRTDTPPVWVAGTGDFDLGRRPEASGLRYAAVWQGALDVPRTWGGVTLDVDENVAARPSPSAAPPSAEGEAVEQ